MPVVLVLKPALEQCNDFSLRGDSWPQEVHFCRGKRGKRTQGFSGGCQGSGGGTRAGRINEQRIENRCCCQGLGHPFGRCALIRIIQQVFSLLVEIMRLIVCLLEHVGMIVKEKARVHLQGKVFK
jgi:hypothetical protein